MFYYLNGILTYRDINTCVIDCGGVGYKLTVSLITSEELASSMNKQVRLYTHLSVREDGIELFGFGSGEERLCFNQLTGVSGVGPKAAMSILSTMTPDTLALAVCTNDIKGISRSPGIGKKTAERIILELRDKVSGEVMSGNLSTGRSDASAAIAASSGAVAEATEALAVLGYDRNTITTVLKSIDPNGLDAGGIIKAALKKLAR